MATLTPTTAAQYVQNATFRWTSADAMVDTSDALTNFKATTGVFDVIPLPYGAQVIGGLFTVLVVSNDSGTATVKLGDSANDDRYSKNTTIDLKTLGATALPADVGTVLSYVGYESLGEYLRLTIANNTGDATTGEFLLQVSYVVDGREPENLRTY